jgi:hypothetical protein
LPGVGAAGDPSGKKVVVNLAGVAVVDAQQRE